MKTFCEFKAAVILNRMLKNLKLIDSFIHVSPYRAEIRVFVFFMISSSLLYPFSRWNEVKH